MKTKRTAAHPVDVHVGKRLRLRRTNLGFKQVSLGDAIGVGFQQIQRYERGEIRIGASRLYDLSKALDVPVSFFFDDMPAEIARRAIDTSPETDPLSSPYVTELIDALRAIDDDEIYKALLSLLKALADR